MDKAAIENKLEAILEKAQQTKARLKDLEPEIKAFEKDVKKYINETEKPQLKVIK